MPDYKQWDAVQERARKAILHNFVDVNCLAAAAPTGFGKTRLGANLMHFMDSRNCNWIWYTHRKTLLKQTADAFAEQGLDFGIRASGYEEQLDVTKPGQIAMVQSEKTAITGKRASRDYHDAKFVVIDEAHANKTGFADALIKHHLEQGAKVLLLTATPVGIERAERLIILAHLSEMREIGALLEAVSYTVPRQDMKHVKKMASGEFSATGQREHLASQQVVGNILHHWKRLQADHFGLLGAPTIGFAPCVKSSMTMTDVFCAAGVKSAHIDGEDIYLGERDLDGEPIIYQSDHQKRKWVFTEIEEGRIKVVWNRFVLREGVDIPRLGHAIIATAVGTTESWVQMIGRILRAHDSLETVIIQDHGGNCHRVGLGDPNQDREWELGDTNKSLIAQAKEERKDDKEDLQKACPNQKCARVFPRSKWASNGFRCPACGQKSIKQVETIIQADGTLVKFYPKSEKRKNVPPCDRAWAQTYYSMRNATDFYPTFNQVGAAFEQRFPNYQVCKETNRIRDRVTLETFPLYYSPKDTRNWNKGVDEVLYKDMNMPNRGD